MEVIKWTRNDDPACRCDALKSDGTQCSNKAEPGVTRCPLHGANRQLAAQEQKSMRMYRLAKWQSRINEFADHDKIKTLREEVALLRMILESKVNAATDTTDLLIMSGPVTEMVMKVQKLVESCDKLETKSGSLLDRQKVQNLASGLMNVVASKINEYAEANDVAPEEVTGLLNAIADSFLEVLKNE